MTRKRAEMKDFMHTDPIITQQPVKPAKVEQARALRRRMTEEEKILWRHLRGNRLRGFHFRRQQVIDGFIVDFYCHAAGLVVEVDGEIHRQQAAYDRERDRALVARGLRVVRFENEEVRKDVGEVLARIAKELPNPPTPFHEGKGEKVAVDTEFPLSGAERGSGGEVFAPGRVSRRERLGAGFADCGAWENSRKTTIIKRESTWSARNEDQGKGRLT